MTVTTGLTTGLANSARRRGITLLEILAASLTLAIVIGMGAYAFLTIASKPVLAQTTHKVADLLASESERTGAPVISGLTPVNPPVTATLTNLIAASAADQFALTSGGHPVSQATTIALVDVLNGYQLGSEGPHTLTVHTDHFTCTITLAGTAGEANQVEC